MSNLSVLNRYVIQFALLLDTLFTAMSVKVVSTAPSISESSNLSLPQQINQLIHKTIHPSIKLSFLSTQGLCPLQLEVPLPSPSDLHLLWSFLYLYQPLQVVDGVHSHHESSLQKQKKKRGPAPLVCRRRWCSAASGDG